MRFIMKLKVYGECLGQIMDESASNRTELFVGSVRSEECGVPSEECWATHANINLTLGTAFDSSEISIHNSLI
jgi:hypothetical protein